MKKFLKQFYSEEFSFFISTPAVLWQIFFLYLPFFILIFHSFYDSASSFTLEHYLHVFTPTYIKIIFHSLKIAILTTFFCLLLAYPISYFLAIKTSPRFKTFLFFLIILPSWTSLIVQIYAWFFLLDKNNFISQTLYKLGILSTQTHLLNNYFAIFIAMVAVYCPFMVMPIYTSLEKIDKKILEASADLGATRYHTFKRIIFPLSLPGVYAGTMLVFFPAFGEFAIPNLLGGSKVVFWGNIVVDKFLIYRDWQSGAAFVIMGIILSGCFMMSLYYITHQLMSRRRN
jgi:spermidine/putrescine transport system permease protein